MIMELLQRRAGRREKEGSIKIAAVCRYVEAAAFLSLQPKFSDRYDDTSPENVNPAAVGTRSSAENSNTAGSGTGGSGASAVAVSGGAVYSNEDRETRRRRKKRVQGLKDRKNQEKILDHQKATSDKMES